MGKTVNVAQFVSIAVAASGKSEEQIAKEVGYAKPNVITMIREGTAKLPVNKVNALA